MDNRDLIAELERKLAELRQQQRSKMMDEGEALYWDLNENRKQRQPRQTHRLHPNKLRTLEPGNHNDGKGLYLYVDGYTDEAGEVHASRRWLLRTTIAGKESWLGLGSLSEVTLREARDEAAKLRR